MILGSAIRFYLTSDNKLEHPIVMTGVRHADIFEQMHNLGIDYKRGIAIQGFINSKGEFLDRYAAVEEAKSAGQISKNFHGVMLYSEDIFPEQVEEKFCILCGKTFLHSGKGTSICLDCFYKMVSLHDPICDP